MIKRFEPGILLVVLLLSGCVSPRLFFIAHVQDGETGKFLPDAIVTTEPTEIMKPKRFLSGLSKVGRLR
ncbi:hypothetical protein CH330_09995 [candidate division WOR-3 bacterium JGI_Cruoil_03_51_56]|uniref:Uncharacterized protein n=1 Tax=candidate division WOR-3 bacterium JGI_Cruoil_03_51_56 TaxID=1973747 RepID=A0A235BNT6_UNCW3|nr:MAG: hypothetical protein CH330_09995 [candidate division WOR-3 bacterium JGI_Cruoil_03_51_56]